MKPADLFHQIQNGYKSISLLIACPVVVNIGTNQTLCFTNTASKAVN